MPPRSKTVTPTENGDTRKRTRIKELMADTAIGRSIARKRNTKAAKTVVLKYASGNATAIEVIETVTASQTKKTSKAKKK
ncbi:MAG: hypothetical protein WCJ81_08590 [bacterium]